jgi:hypothetical protein
LTSWSATKRIWWPSWRCSSHMPQRRYRPLTPQQLPHRTSKLPARAHKIPRHSQPLTGIGAFGPRHRSRNAPGAHRAVFPRCFRPVLRRQML